MYIFLEQVKLQISLKRLINLKQLGANELCMPIVLDYPR